uniref:CLU central domain-containing protein n=1 Tax=Fagus sylvatica TaxID=28930 RepID=A0A2N9JAA0_FAGSY
MLSEAYTLFSEAFSILQQVTGPMHQEVANCCRYLAMVLYHAGDMQQHKELIINERYGNMALFYHGLNQTELALRHMSRALLLLSLSSGPDHPDVAATFILDSSYMNAQKQKGQALNAASAQKAIDIFWYSSFAYLFVMDIFIFIQDEREGIRSHNSWRVWSSGTSVNKSLNAAVIWREVPEKELLCAAEVRKKAAARGGLICPHGVPVQALPPLTQLLNIINSGQREPAIVMQ